MRYLKVLSICTLCFWFCLPSFAHDLKASYARQKDAPVRIVAMLNSINDLAARLDFVNQSDKTVTALQVGWVIESPPGCSTSVHAQEIHFARQEEVEIAPHGKYSGNSYRVGTADAYNKARAWDSHHLYLLFGVVSVKFLDGSSWHYDLKRQQTFDANADINQFACTPEFEERKRAAQQEQKQPPMVLRPQAGKPILREAPLLLSKSSSIPGDVIQCTWVCTLDSGRYCTRVFNPPPTCFKDDHGVCCFTSDCPNPLPPNTKCADTGCYLSCSC